MDCREIGAFDSLPIFLEAAENAFDKPLVSFSNNLLTKLVSAIRYM